MATRTRFHAAQRASLNWARTCATSMWRRVARGLDRVVERHVDRHRDDDGDQVQAERGGDRWQRRRAAVGDAGHQGEDEGAAEGGDHEPRVDDGPVHLLEGGDERAVVGLAQAGHDRVRVEREGAGDQAHGEGGAHQGGRSRSSVMPPVDPAGMRQEMVRSRTLIRDRLNYRHGPDRRTARRAPRAARLPAPLHPGSALGAAHQGRGAAEPGGHAARPRLLRPGRARAGMARPG